MAYYSRKSPRIPGFDYSNVNYYYITICTREKKWIFGAPGKLNRLGRIAWQDMMDISNHYGNVVVDIFNVLPNHIHAVIILNENGSANINQIVAGFKSGVSRKIHKLYPDLELWQRSYYDEVIRNQSVYEKIWTYVRYNAEKWDEDEFSVPME